MPRSLWSGSLSFGLVNVPVRLVSGAAISTCTSASCTRRTARRSRIQRWCAKEDQRGPLRGGRPPLRARRRRPGRRSPTRSSSRSRRARRARSTSRRSSTSPTSTRSTSTTPTSCCPPAKTTGRCAPTSCSSRSWARPTGPRSGASSCARRSTWRSSAPATALLSLTTMLLHDEVRPTKGIAAGRGKAQEAARQRARLIEALTVDWDPASYEDHYRARLLAVVDQKRKGKTITVPDQVDEPSPVPDLMAALRESLDAARGDLQEGRRRRRRRRARRS